MKSDKKNYVIFSPINEYGGINLEVGFIANIISQKHNVKVISLGNYYNNSSVFLFNNNLDYNSLNRIIYQKDYLIRLITFMIGILKPHKNPHHFRVDNTITRLPLFNIYKRKFEILKNEILKADEVILCSQLTSNFMKEIIEISHELNKKIIFRTTGHISAHHLTKSDKFWIEKVSLYIHHSERNKITLQNFTKLNNHFVIDQSAYSESQLLEIPLKNRKVHRFFTLSRLQSLKQIDIVIKAFHKIATKDDFLTIYGNGDDEKRLIELANNHPAIFFKGKIKLDELQNLYQENDCLIIASKMEAGPYTAIESMAAATPIISTRVGAMEERLPNYAYFYDGTVENLIEKMQEIMILNENSVQEFSSLLREKYVSIYAEKQIINLYKTLIN